MAHWSPSGGIGTARQCLQTDDNMHEVHVVRWCTLPPETSTADLLARLRRTLSYDVDLVHSTVKTLSFVAGAAGSWSFVVDQTTSALPRPVGLALQASANPGIPVRSTFFEIVTPIILNAFKFVSFQDNGTDPVHPQDQCRFYDVPARLDDDHPSPHKYVDTTTSTMST
ncbi:Uncharacterized protein PBTT_05041 [Plasmodiophora brassicae]